MAVKTGRKKKVSPASMTSTAMLAGRKSTGSRPMASAGFNGKSKSGLTAKYPRYAICIDNRGNEVSLQIGKVYEIIAPHINDRPYDVRVIDEEGEDYLYHASQFVHVDLPAKGRRFIASLRHVSV